MLSFEAKRQFSQNLKGDHPGQTKYQKLVEEETRKRKTKKKNMPLSQNKDQIYGRKGGSTENKEAQSIKEIKLIYILVSI